MVEEVEEGEVDDGCLEGVPLPTFDEEKKLYLLDLQDDDDIRRCKSMLTGELMLPDKLSVLQEPWSVQQFLRHRSLFRLTPQDILIRIWVEPDGRRTQLIVVGKEKMDKLIDKVHNFSESMSALSHVGRRKTFDTLSKSYYGFGMRRQVNDKIAVCGPCNLNEFKRTSAEKTGNHVRTEENDTYTCDYLGPLHGIGRTSTGQPQYVFLAIDSLSKYVITYVTKSTSDTDTFQALMHMRSHLSGFPSRLAADNAIFPPQGKSTMLLKEHGVTLLHGLAYTSRCQAIAESAIKTLTRLITKLSSDQPTLPFNIIVRESALTMNSTPHSALPRKLTPREVHFSNCSRTFLHTNPLTPVTVQPKTIQEQMTAARATGRDVLTHEVEVALKRKKKEAATNYTLRLKIGDICLKKRTSFPSNTPKKLCYRQTVDAFKIVARVATNMYKCVSIISNEHFYYPGDVLIKVKLSVEQARKLVQSMEQTLMKGTAVTEPRETRSRARARERADNVRTAQSMFVWGKKPSTRRFERVNEWNPSV